MKHYSLSVRIMGVNCGVINLGCLMVAYTIKLVSDHARHSQIIL